MDQRCRRSSVASVIECGDGRSKKEIEESEPGPERQSKWTRYQLDTARVRYDHDGYHVEISQTRTVFAIKITPIDGGGTGRDKESRFEYAKQLCAKIFSSNGKMDAYDKKSGMGIPTPIPDFKAKIVSFTFNSARTKELALDKAVVGNPRTMADDGIDGSRTLERGEYNIDNMLNTWNAWQYWFRQIHWWNDGKAVGFYFIKISGPGGWIPSFEAKIDQDWFHPPRDQSGNAIPEKGLEPPGKQ